MLVTVKLCQGVKSMDKIFMWVVPSVKALMDGLFWSVFDFNRRPTNMANYLGPGGQ